MREICNEQGTAVQKWTNSSPLGTQGARQWVGRRVIELIEMGGPRFIERLQATRAARPDAADRRCLGKRLKINSARWRVRRAERVGPIRCLQHSGLWEVYWESKLAA